MTKPQDRGLSRRSFAKAIGSGSLIVGFDAITGSWVSAEEVARGTPFAQLPALDGTLSFDSATRNLYAQDNGQIVHEQPIAVLKPGSVEDISRIVKFARRFGLRPVLIDQFPDAFLADALRIVEVALESARDADRSLRQAQFVQLFELFEVGHHAHEACVLLECLPDDGGIAHGRSDQCQVGGEHYPLVCKRPILRSWNSRVRSR